MKSILLRGGVAAALVGAAMSAQALTLSLSGFATGYENTTVGSPNVSAQTGAFQGTLSDAPGFNANPFITYCVELTQNFAWGNPLTGYSIVDGLTYFASQAAGAGNIVNRLGRLFTYLGGISDPATSTESAAIQLAVWESVYETGGTLNVASGAQQGSFLATSAPAAVITRANQILASAAALTQSMYSISVLRNADRQDFVLVQSNQVPEPATLGLVAVALAAGVGAARRKKA